MTELEYDILRGVIEELERNAGVPADHQRLRALREKVQAAELTRRLKATASPPKPKTNWPLLLQWAITAAVLIGAVLAQLLGVSVKELIP